jgi:adenylate cyclase
MPSEIEHKFLVRPQLLRPLPRGERLRQGYLCTEPAVRVRLVTRGKTSKAFLTIKGRGLRERAEYEYPIPVADARKLLKMCGAVVLEKIRRRIGRWEVDEFLGRHRGLWLAEYELRSRREKLPKLPAWIEREVTGDPQYANSRLAGLPAKKR